MITLTDRAREVVRDYLDKSDGEFTALRIGISGDARRSPLRGGLQRRLRQRKSQLH